MLINQIDLSLHSFILSGSLTSILDNIDPIISVKDIHEVDNKSKKIKINKIRIDVPTINKQW
ncbi:MAG: hypothetical protein ACXAC7_16785 [Candidatus Hodarchaeales archaeon]